MRYLLLVTIIICFKSSILSAQEVVDSIPKIKISHEIGFNTTALLKEIFIRNNSDSLTNSINPYFFNYKLLLGKKHGFRLGFGGNISNNVSKKEGFSDTKTNSNSYFDIRLGYEYRFHLGRRLVAFTAFDAVFHHSYSSLISDTGFDVASTKNNTISFGGGPILGLQYNIRKRLWIGTESGIYYRFSENTNLLEFKNNPQFNDGRDIIHSNNVKILPPIALFLGWAF